MLQRGRTGALSAVPSLPTVRLEVPAELNEAQAEEYRAVAGAMPSTWFDASNVPLLKMYVTHVCEERRLGKLLSEFNLESLKEDEGLKLYDRLSKIHERESKAASTLATKMRLTQQSKVRADKVVNPPSFPKPWESGD